MIFPFLYHIVITKTSILVLATVFKTLCKPEDNGLLLTK